jgi:hypothetical protein
VNLKKKYIKIIKKIQRPKKIIHSNSIKPSSVKLKNIRNLQYNNINVEAYKNKLHFIKNDKNVGSIFTFAVFLRRWSVIEGFQLHAQN